MKRKPTIILSFVFPIEMDVIHAVGFFLEKLSVVVDLKHELTIKVVPAIVVGVPSSTTDVGFGAFFVADKKSSPEIIIGGQQIPDLERDEWLDMLEDTILHEIVHYEQYRDGKKLSHRGLQNRMNYLRENMAYMKNQSFDEDSE